MMSRYRLVTTVVKGDTDQREIVSRLTNFVGFSEVDQAEHAMLRNKALIELSVTVQGTMVLLDQRTGEVASTVTFGY